MPFVENIPRATLPDPASDDPVYMDHVHPDIRPIPLRFYQGPTLEKALQRDWPVFVNDHDLDKAARLVSVDVKLSPDPDAAKALWYVSDVVVDVRGSKQTVQVDHTVVSRRQQIKPTELTWCHTLQTLREAANLLEREGKQLSFPRVPGPNGAMILMRDGNQSGPEKKEPSHGRQDRHNPSRLPVKALTLAAIYWVLHPRPGEKDSAAVDVVHFQAVEALARTLGFHRPARLYAVDEPAAMVVDWETEKMRKLDADFLVEVLRDTARRYYLGGC